MATCDRFEREERRYHAEVGRGKWLHAADAAGRLEKLYRARAGKMEKQWWNMERDTALAWAGYWGVRREEMQSLATRASGSGERAFSRANGDLTTEDV